MSGVSSQDTDPFLMAPTLRLFTNQMSRKLQNFAHAYAVAPGSAPDCEYLSGLLTTLARDVLRLPLSTALLREI